MNYYAGIGSRETPIIILHYFKKLGAYFANHDFILRSGGAKGADKAFEIGCDNAKGQKEIYLPWSGFEGSNSKLILSNIKAFEIAASFHPAWERLSDGAKKLQARNSHQVLGWDLNTPSEFVICWTKNGKGQGGTGQAIRIAKHYEIPIFDMGKYENVETIKIELKSFLINSTNMKEKDFKGR